MRLLPDALAVIQEPAQRTTAFLDAKALCANLEQVRRSIAAEVRIMSVVKADAYGHGAALVAPALEAAGSDAFAVASVEEGVELRAAGVRAPVLVLYGLHPELVETALAHDLMATVIDAGDIDRLAAAVRHCGGGPLAVHVEVDTGMTRLGVRPEEAESVLAAVRATPELTADGLFAHLGNADDVRGDFASGQVGTFAAVVAGVEAAGLRPRWVHLANSAATLTRADTHWDMVRPGVCLYGVTPEAAVGVDLQPVMSLESSVWRLWEVPAGRHVGYNQTFVTQRPTRIAVLPVGYADGLHRGLSNRGQVVVGGRRAPLIGRVCMDVVMIDVTDLAEVELFAPVLLWGRRGDVALPVDEVARACDTIAYEVLARVGKRVPRKWRS